MIFQSKGFNINNFQIPSFTLSQGEMIRLWVQQMPISSEGASWGVVGMKKTIEQLNQEKVKIVVGAAKVKRGWLDIFKPITAWRYLKEKLDMPTEEVEKSMSQFGIKANYKIKDLGTAHQKILAIVCAFQTNDIVAFDYYGLSPMTEQKLTEFVKLQLKKGKSAIGFDNLQYKPEMPDNERINNIEVQRIESKFT